MTRIFVTVVVCIGCLAIGLMAGLLVLSAMRSASQSHSRNEAPTQSSTCLTDEARREHYLMPTKDSPAYKEWTQKYGDTADGWELWTLGFHSRYLQELTKKVNALSKDVNEPNQPAKAN